LAAGGAINSASYSESISSSIDHSMEGKAIEEEEEDSSTIGDASTKELRSKGPKDERDRLKEIIGRSSPISMTEVAASSRALSRAAVAGEQDLEAITMWHTILM
jgi:hypothetical protein